MGRFNEIEVVIIVALGLKKVLTTQQLIEETGLNQGTVYYVLNKLKKKGLVKSNKPWKQLFLGLPMPDETPISSKEKIHMLATELEELWKNPEFQRTASQLFEASSLEEIKTNFMKIQEERKKYSNSTLTLRYRGDAPLFYFEYCVYFKY